MESAKPNTDVPVASVSTIYDSMSREDLIVSILLCGNFIEITPTSKRRVSERKIGV